MRNLPIILLIVVPAIVGASVWYLDEIDVLTPGARSVEAGRAEDMPVIATAGFCGLALTLVAVPVLLAESYKAWKRGDRSWKWQVALVLPVALAGNKLTLGTSLFGLILLPLNLIVFGVVLLITLVRVARRNIRSVFFYVLLVYTLLTAGVTALVFYSFSRITLCYCPVSRRSLAKDLLLRPLYAWRRERLRRQLGDGAVCRAGQASGVGAEGTWHAAR